MRFVFTILILMISGSFTASAGTCFQDCDDKIFVKRPNSLPSNPIRVLNKSNEYVLENINIDVFRDKPIGFKPHGLKIVYRADGEPVRTGKSSFKFEVRDGDCGYNPPPKWNDCKTYRERHELVQHKNLMVKFGCLTQFIFPKTIRVLKIGQIMLLIQVQS